MVAAPVFGWLANRTSRWALIGFGVVLWSLASGGSGLAQLYVLMLATRCLVGIGEAAYGPVAPDIISDLFPVKKRGQVLAWFYAAIPVGGALGYTLGSLCVKLTGDWRWAFYVVVPPGILLGVWAFLMREPKRGLADAVETGQRKESWADYLILLRTPSYVLNLVGMTFTFFALGGIAFWVPAYLKYRGVQELLGMPPAMAFGLIVAATGLAATIAGGLAGDALRGRVSGAYFMVSGVAMLVGFPLLLLVIALPFPLAWLPLIGFSFCLFFNTGPTNTITANVVPSLMRSPGFAVAILVMHLLGDAASPTLMGTITGSANRYDLSFLMVAAVTFLGGVCWMCGTAYLKGDTDRASGPAPAAGADAIQPAP
jgi:MFS family permease